jgi:predicted Zn-dependent protease with MMP-like domain
MRRSPRSHPRELIARRVVRHVLTALPPEIRAEAERCAIEFVTHSEDTDLLGLFQGNARNDPEPQSAEELPRITLFLDNLWDFVDGDLREYREEVKTTLLHELGHYLGLEEDQVEALGLG